MPFNLESVLRSVQRWQSTIESSPNFLSEVGPCAALVTGASTGDRQTIDFALDAGANVDGHPQLGVSPLMIATSQGHFNIVKLLIEKGASVNYRNSSPENPSAVQLAIIYSRKEILEILLQAGADVDDPDSQGMTPLMTACTHDVESDQAPYVQQLLRGGANPSFANKFGITAIHHAAGQGNADVIDILCSEVRSNLNPADKEGLTPLQWAVNGIKAGAKERVVSRLLLAGAAQPRCSPGSFQCPLFRAARVNHVGVMRLLVEKGMAAVGGSAALPFAVYIAVADGHAKILDILLSAEGVNKRRRWAKYPYQSSTFLHYAAVRCRLACATVLLAAGADEAATDHGGTRVEELIGAGVDVGPEGESAFRRVLERGPAFRARSWAWPAVTEASETSAAAIVSSARAQASRVSGARPGRTPLQLRIYRRPKNNRHFFAGVIGRSLSLSS
ncbi:unnamed protein product [Ascophyllum nodosum]